MTEKIRRFMNQIFDENWITLYLYFGYVPRVPEEINIMNLGRCVEMGILKTHEQTPSESEMVNEGIRGIQSSL